MAAPRASSVKVLRNLQRASSPIPVIHNLHITDINSSPLRHVPLHKKAYLPMSLQDLRNECRKRTLAPNATTHELINRLTGHDHLQARAFSVAMKRVATGQSRRPVTTKSSAEIAPQRYFNTSRANKAVGDTSTIDFAYLPKLFEESWGPEPAQIRVPILPHVDSDDAEAVFEQHPHLDAAAGGYQDTPGHEHIMKPTIVTVEETLADGTHMDGLNDHLSPMSDVHDGQPAEMSVEMLTRLTEIAGDSAKQFVDITKDKDQDTIRKLWNGFLDDLLGPGKAKSA